VIPAGAIIHFLSPYHCGYDASIRQRIHLTAVQFFGTTSITYIPMKRGFVYLTVVMD
jgi:hypothetical protein